MVTTEERAHHLPPNPDTPSPTDNGRMSTMAKAEDRSTSPNERRPNTVSKVYPVRINMRLLGEAMDKGATEGLGLNALVGKLLREYVERSD